jgi:tRNA nucleotidyltransferase (CCA-adding enzyme)
MISHPCTTQADESECTGFRDLIWSRVAVRSIHTVYHPKRWNGVLVDTQSMASVRGVSAETRVHIVDHHPIKADIPTSWTISSEDVGATTTIFVEDMQERDDDLSMIHATTLLLGIYEDTGSLTYTRTTARDLHAASYLLEQDANLRIASDFLNHRREQQKLYDLCENT